MKVHVKTESTSTPRCCWFKDPPVADSLSTHAQYNYDKLLKQRESELNEDVSDHFKEKRRLEKEVINLRSELLRFQSSDALATGEHDRAIHRAVKEAEVPERHHFSGVLAQEKGEGEQPFGGRDDQLFHREESRTYYDNMNNPTKIYYFYGGIRCRIFARANVVPVDHGCHTTYPDFDLVNDTSWRHFTTYKRPTSNEPIELINNKPWRQKMVPFSIDFSSWNQKHQQKSTNTQHT